MFFCNENAAIDCVVWHSSAVDVYWYCLIGKAGFMYLLTTHCILITHWALFNWLFNMDFWALENVYEPLVKLVKLPGVGFDKFQTCQNQEVHGCQLIY